MCQLCIKFLVSFVILTITHYSGQLFCKYEKSKLWQRLSYVAVSWVDTWIIVLSRIHLLLVDMFQIFRIWYIFFVNLLLGSNITNTSRKHLTSIPWETFSVSTLYRPWKMFGRKSEYKPNMQKEFPWFICRELAVHTPFNRNLLSMGSLFRMYFHKDSQFFIESSRLFSVSLTGRGRCVRSV